jgi:FkbM family methyltransferase
MGLLRRIWGCLPESAAKNYLRAAIHNRRAANDVRFFFKRGVFTTRIGAIELSTYDHPFLLPGAVQRYQKYHRVGAGEMIIDAGAYDGHLSLFFAVWCGPSGRVIAVEPDEQNIARIRKNLELNPALTNIEIVAEALWDRGGQVEFSQLGTMASSIYWSPDGHPKVCKPATSIDAIAGIYGLARVDFIKMDIEGAEGKALAGSAQVMRRFQPDFAIESYHLVDGQPTRSAVEHSLKAAGYGVDTVFYGRECITYGRKLIRPHAARAAH